MKRPLVLVNEIFFFFFCLYIGCHINPLLCCILLLGLAKIQFLSIFPTCCLQFTIRVLVNLEMIRG